jgi:Fe-S oxidoreductase/nitrate reductase gamma subunit
MPETVVPAREVFRHFSPGLVVAFYVLSAAALAIFAYGAWQRVQKYRRGRPAARWAALGARLRRAGGVVARHSTLRKRDALAGWSHALVFWGFLALFVGTLVIMVDHDVLRPLSPALQFWRGTFYLWYSVTLDVLGVAFVLGLLLMAARRWWLRPPQLDYDRPDRRPDEYDRRGYRRDDQLFLWSLVWIGVTGFAVEGLRIAADRPPFEAWSVVGWQVANLIDAVGVAPATASVVHAYVWWLHGLLALAFVAYLPYSKAVHMVVDLVNLLFHDPEAGRRLPAVPEGAPAAGYAALTDFTWKELLDLDACTKCGRCHAACPARASGAPLSPRDLILELREVAEGSLGGRSWLHEAAGDRANGHGAVVTGAVVRPETLWACTTCLACVEACPVGIEHVPLIVRMRRKLVEDGVMDGNLQSVLEKLGRYGNSFGQSERNRARWTQGLPFKVKDARKEPVELLWFVGDFASYDPGLQELTRGVARVFHRAGLDFGILYDAERNSGNDVRRVGEEGLYQALVEKNLAALAKARFGEIVTTDPHSYNTLRFEYPEFGGTFRVRHYTEVIQELLETGRLPLARRLRGVATYHDPCYLGRYAGVTEPPRAILEALGLRLVDMPRNRANSFCCGAGGGRIWMGDGVSGERPSEQRIREALGIPGLEYFVVACPKDVTMYRDAVKTTGHEGRLAVRDLIELVEAALAPAPAEAASAPAGAR